MNEGLAKQRLKRILQQDDCNAIIYSFAGSMFHSAGIPDWFVAHRIWSGWIEHKYSNGKLTPGQKVQIEKLKHRGVKALVVRTTEKFDSGTWKHPRSGILMHIEDVSGYQLCTFDLKSDTSGNQILEWLRDYDKPHSDT